MLLMRLHRNSLAVVRTMALTLVGGFLSTACTGPLSALDPAGPAAAAIGSLWWVMLAGATAILTLVVALLALPFIRRTGAEVSARRWIVGGGIVFPAIVLALLLGFGLVAGERLLPRSDARLVRVEAEASRWRWTFTHARTDGSTVTTPDVLHIPAGRPVDVVLTTRDVIHSFWVPRLAGKMDAIPGHAGHVFRVVAHDAAGWARFQAGEGGA
jgi:heme/copper-type cytochrome/quinol oxidase subunit 2